MWFCSLSDLFSKRVLVLRKEDLFFCCFWRFDCYYGIIGKHDREWISTYSYVSTGSTALYFHMHYELYAWNATPCNNYDYSCRSLGGAYLPRTQSGRSVLACWWLLTVILAATYSGNLIAFLTVTTEKPPFDTLGEMVDQNEYKWGLIGGSAAITLFQVSCHIFFVYPRRVCVFVV